ncbi:MAG: formylglycine-generating enzyme family protein [Maribacter sp.]
MEYKRTILLTLCLLWVSPSISQNVIADNYLQELNGTELVIEMVSIPEGDFTMGSQASEENRGNDEGPVHKVKIDAFWMSRYEITWELYNLFVNRNIDKFENDNKGGDVGLKVDAIAGATVPYVDMSLGMGTKAGFPVGNITQHAATTFCKWLSAKTGYFYRLPTEAEWEYAARAGSTTPYYFGKNEQDLDKYAWYYKNSKNSYHKVGEKEPNAWGLYDIYGNVAEWTLDQYIAEAYQKRKSTITNPMEPAISEYPISVRGGSYDDDAQDLRSANRQGSIEKWKMRDPQFPKSKWWNTDAPFVGFRIVRQQKVSDTLEMKKYWN